MRKPTPLLLQQSTVAFVLGARRSSSLGRVCARVRVHGTSLRLCARLCVLDIPANAIWFIVLYFYLPSSYCSVRPNCRPNRLIWPCGHGHGHEPPVSYVRLLGIDGVANNALTLSSHIGFSATFYRKKILFLRALASPTFSSSSSLSISAEPDHIRLSTYRRIPPG